MQHGSAPATDERKLSRREPCIIPRGTRNELDYDLQDGQVPARVFHASGERRSGTFDYPREGVLVRLTHSLAPQARSTAVLLVLVDGCGARLVTAGTSFALAPGQAHFIRPWQEYSVAMPKGCAATLLTCRGPDERVAATRSHTVAAHATFSACTTRGWRDWLARWGLPDGGRIVAGVEAAIAAAKASRELAPSSARPVDFRIRRAIDHVHDGLNSAGRKSTVSQLADLAGMSMPHFFDRFRACTGLTPRCYANVIRLELMLACIARSDSSFAALSLRLGFADQSHFTRFFRRRVGINPRTYRAASLSEPSELGDNRYVA